MKINADRVTREFISYLENLSAEDWSKKVNKNWTVKDMVAHLVGWAREVDKELPLAWKSRTVLWFMKVRDENFTNFNRKQVKYYADYTPKELLEEWKKWGAVFDLEVKAIGEEKLRKEKRYEWVFDEEDDNHELWHFNQVKKLFE
jgi:hypothetical protein